MMFLLYIYKDIDIWANIAEEVTVTVVYLETPSIYLKSNKSTRFTMRFLLDYYSFTRNSRPYRPITLAFSLKLNYKPYNMCISLIIFHLNPRILDGLTFLSTAKMV